MRGVCREEGVGGRIVLCGASLVVLFVVVVVVLFVSSVMSKSWRFHGKVSLGQHFV